MAPRGNPASVGREVDEIDVAVVFKLASEEMEWLEGPGIPETHGLVSRCRCYQGPVWGPSTTVDGRDVPFECHDVLPSFADIPDGELRVITTTHQISAI